MLRTCASWVADATPTVCAWNASAAGSIASANGVGTDGAVVVVLTTAGGSVVVTATTDPVPRSAPEYANGTGRIGVVAHRQLAGADDRARWGCSARSPCTTDRGAAHRGSSH